MFSILELTLDRIKEWGSLTCKLDLHYEFEMINYCSILMEASEPK